MISFTKSCSFCPNLLYITLGMMTGKTCINTSAVYQWKNGGLMEKDYYEHLSCKLNSLLFFKERLPMSHKWELQPVPLHWDMSLAPRNTFSVCVHMGMQLVIEPMSFTLNCIPTPFHLRQGFIRSLNYPGCAQTLNSHASPSQKAGIRKALPWQARNIYFCKNYWQIPL